MTSFHRVLLICCAVILTAPAIAPAQATQPAGRFDLVSVRGGSTRDGGQPTTLPARADAAPLVAFDWSRVTVALGMVIGLIFLMRFAGKRWLGVSAATGAGRCVRVLGRTTTGPRQQIVIIQIGRRIVVAADNAGQMTSLCQITEPDEVAGLLGQLNETQPSPATGAFTKWFRKAEGVFEDSDEDESLVPAAAGMMQASTEDPSLEQARGEIAGLMDKVRGLSKQFRK